MVGSKKSKLLSGVFWLGLWQALALFINNPVFIPGPLDVIKAGYSLMGTSNFYQAILGSLGKILLAFVLATCLGLALGILSYINHNIRSLIRIPLAFMKSVPLVCFIIILLIWSGPNRLPIIVSTIVGLPLISEAVVTGLEETDEPLLQMAEAFHMSWPHKLRYIYFYQARAFVKRALLSTSGLVFKAGITAELIGLSKNSIGELLYFNKLYLKTDELFFWVIIILVLSLLFEKLIEKVLELI